jgi:hypothetical protein
MDYERGEVGYDSIPGLHIHRDSLLHRVGLMFPPPDRIVKILSRVRQLSARNFCQAMEFLILVDLLSSAADQNKMRTLKSTKMYSWYSRTVCKIHMNSNKKGFSLTAVF